MRKLILMSLLGPMMLLAQSNSQILNMTEVNIKIGHESQFMEGMKTYNKCYADNNGDSDWRAWRRVQGKNMAVGFTQYMGNWAEMDNDSDAANAACRSLFTDLIMPHVESYDSNIATTMPDYSNSEPNSKDKVYVTYFNVNNPKAFLESIKTVSDALQEIEGNKRGYWFSNTGGGPEAFDYMVVWPFENYADLDIEMDSVWEVCAKKHGEKKTNEARNKFRNALNDSWSYIYDSSVELSYSPTSDSK